MRRDTWLLALLVWLAAPPLSAQDAGWPVHGHDLGNQRFSPLREIHSGNVGGLVPRRIFQTGTARQHGFVATPIVTDGVMYVTTPFSSIIAWDLRTGRERWRHEHRLGRFIDCCGPTNRGAAAGHGLVYYGTLDARLLALDAESGAVRWEVEDSDPDSAYSITMAPQIVGDIVVVGASGAEFATRGRLTAYDARTGERRWRWHAVPSPEEGGWWGGWAERSPWGDPLGRDIAAERADSARYADAWRIGGGAVWTTPAYDSASGLLILGTGNPTPEYDATRRPGDNLYTASIVALEASTGRLRWHHQYLPHDPGDYDAANPPILADVEGRRVVVHASKTGHVMLLDALTGEPIRRSGALVPQERMMAAATPEGIRRAPGAGGGADWHPSAYSPATGFMYVPLLHMPMKFTMFDETPVAGRLYRRGTENPIPGDSVWTDLTAVELATARAIWTVRRHGGDLRSGALATAGGLVFTAGERGWVQALDARTGKVLWEYHCGALVNAPPITVSVDGAQYVIVVAGGSNYEGGWGSAVLLFGLPEAWRPR